jgi:tetratricopeptide (TPR) repeat protein
MEEFVAIQKISDFYLFHFYNQESGFTSFFIDKEEELKSSLSEFLSYGNWLPDDSEIIEHWDTLAESSSEEYILKITKLLDKADFYYCINTVYLARFNSVNYPYSILLPAEDIEEAEEVLDVLDNLENELNKKLEIAENNNDLEKQLEIILELESIKPEDSVLFYNKAQLLDQKGDYENASEALIHSFNLDYENGEVEDLQDVEDYLLEIKNKVKSKTNILHCLATISLYKHDNETALKYYSELIESDENDKIAHLNLGHIYYSHFEDDEKAIFHFKKFIKLETNRNEIEPIKAILDNL